MLRETEPAADHQRRTGDRRVAGGAEAGVHSRESAPAREAHLSKIGKMTLALQRVVTIYISYYLLANIGFDTAENEPFKVC